MKYNLGKMRRQDIAVGGILVVDGKALMIRRAPHEHSSAGYWESPKGSVEWGETPDQALKREFMEEVNLRIELDKVHEIYSHTYNHHEGFKVHFWEIEYFVHLAPGETLDNLKLSVDHDAYRFVDAVEANNLEKIYTDKRESLLRALADKI